MGDAAIAARSEYEWAVLPGFTSLMIGTRGKHNYS